METDLLRYSERGIVRNTKVVDVKIDEEGNFEFPVLVTLSTDGFEKTVRTKHLIGADGAHSVVRQCMGLWLEGESGDLLDRNSVSVQALEAVTLLEAQFPKSTIEQIILHPQLHRSFEWNDVPTCVKQQTEMRFYDGSALGDAYTTYGVDSAQGTLVVVRPDGYVGVFACLSECRGWVNIRGSAFGLSSN
ncbi:hypothetical protein N7447_002575 [Penicillium robsamsonii]|uniref:uncharacterized protein n=1 Tax=Penicillium robsamsonii TaxID=1792511 RepID=UPI002548E994|nr:uncharacterized protein N7447_002575 [Penicillium robsamsonii]KAJ5836549.1 hypothetical protein N7447_002575 [Penicillium robsamsonii]